MAVEAVKAQAPSSPTPPRKPWLVIRPRSGWTALDLREVWRFRDLLLTLALRDIKLRYRQTLLGVAWVVLQPLIGAAIFAFVFGLVARLPTEGAPYFVLSYAGLTAWTLFQTTFTRASTCLVQNANLVSKVYFARLVLPLSTAFGAILDFACGLALLVPMMLAFGIVPSWPVVLLPLWLLLLLLLALGGGMTASALGARYRDVQYLLPVLLQLGMYASPVAYTLGAVPERWRDAYLLNPLAGLLEACRWSLLGTPPPPPAAVASGAVLAVAVFFGGALIFRRVERTFADVI